MMKINKITLLHLALFQLFYRQNLQYMNTTNLTYTSGPVIDDKSVNKQSSQSIFSFNNFIFKPVINASTNLGIYIYI